MIERSINQQEPEMILLFDANMPSLNECRPGCEKDQNYSCLHRLRFRARAVYLDPQEKRYSDLKVVLGFASHLEQCHANNSDAYCLILTRDLDFLRDVKRDYKPGRKKTARLVFGPDPRSVTVNERCIAVQGFRYKGQFRDTILRSVIEFLNNLYRVMVTGIS